MKDRKVNSISESLADLKTEIDEGLKQLSRVEGQLHEQRRRMRMQFGEDDQDKLEDLLKQKIEQLELLANMIDEKYDLLKREMEKYESDG